MVMLGGYKLEKVLGEGCYATVFLATDTSSKQKLAVKCFSKKKVRTVHLSQELEAFHLIRSNPHPNVVRCIEKLEDEEYLFLVQEYLPQGDLLSYLSKKGKLDQVEAKRLFWGLIKAVDHLHSLGIVHRDLKLENVCVDEHGEPKIIDFNLSGRWSNDEQLSRFCGSMGYCAPEIILKRPYRGPEVDVWSLGVVLYVMTYYNFPFAPDPSDVTEEAKRRRVREKTVQAQFLFPREKTQERTEELEDLITSMLAFNPTERTSIKTAMNHPWLREVREKEESAAAMDKERKELEKVTTKGRIWESMLLRILG